MLKNSAMILGNPLPSDFPTGCGNLLVVREYFVDLPFSIIKLVVLALLESLRYCIVFRYDPCAQDRENLPILKLCRRHLHNWSRCNLCSLRLHKVADLQIIDELEIISR